MKFYHRLIRIRVVAFQIFLFAAILFFISGVSHAYTYTSNASYATISNPSNLTDNANNTVIGVQTANVSNRDFTIDLDASTVFYSIVLFTGLSGYSPSSIEIYTTQTPVLTPADSVNASWTLVKTVPSVPTDAYVPLSIGFPEIQTARALKFNFPVPTGIGTYTFGGFYLSSLSAPTDGIPSADTYNTIERIYSDTQAAKFSFTNISTRLTRMEENTGEIGMNYGTAVLAGLLLAVIFAITWKG